MKSKKHFSGGYRGVRNPEGLTPYQELLKIKTARETIQLKRERGELVEKAVVDAGMREAAEVIRSDLFGLLPSRCTTELCNRKLAPEKVRAIVGKIVHDMVTGWVQAEIVTPDSIPKHSQTPRLRLRHNKPDNPAETEGNET